MLAGYRLISDYKKPNTTYKNFVKELLVVAVIIIILAVFSSLILELSDEGIRSLRFFDLGGLVYLYPIALLLFAFLKAANANIDKVGAVMVPAILVGIALDASSSSSLSLLFFVSPTSAVGMLTTLPIFFAGYYVLPKVLNASGEKILILALICGLALIPMNLYTGNAVVATTSLLTTP